MLHIIDRDDVRARVDRVTVRVTRIQRGAPHAPSPPFRYLTQLRHNKNSHPSSQMFFPDSNYA